MTDWETSVRNFEDAVNDAVERFPKMVCEIQRQLMLKAVLKIVYRTPVDTGRARGNWQVSYASGEGAKPSETFDKAGTATVTVLLEKVNKTPDWSPVFVHNNVVYIVALEEGWSKKQAPQGMIRPTLIELTNELR